MTDRVKAFIVHLDDDYRIGDRSSYPSIEQEDENGQKVTLPTDADFIAHAIRAVKGVTRVEPLISDYEDRIARVRVGTELRAKLYEVLKTPL